jgi:hypothetical protein
MSIQTLVTASSALYRISDSVPHVFEIIVREMKVVQQVVSYDVEFESVCTRFFIDIDAAAIMHSERNLFHLLPPSYSSCSPSTTSVYSYKQ